MALVFIDLRTSQPVSFEENQIYGEISALFVQLDATDQSKASKTELRLRPCNSFDFEQNLFKPHNEDYLEDGYIENNKENMLCLDDLSIVELEGQYKHDDGMFLKFMVRTCDNVSSDGSQCASLKDQKEWRKNTGILLFYNR